MDLMQLELEQICNWIILTIVTTVLAMIAPNVLNLRLQLLLLLLQRGVEDVQKVLIVWQTHPYYPKLPTDNVKPHHLRHHAPLHHPDLCAVPP